MFSNLIFNPSNILPIYITLNNKSSVAKILYTTLKFGNNNSNKKRKEKSKKIYLI